MSGTYGIRNKALCGACALLFALPLSGCVSGQTIHRELQELDQMELVETLGADKEGGRVIMSVSTNAKAEETGAEPTVLRTSGNSVAEALEDMPAYTPKRFLFFGHTKHFVLGQTAAEEGLGPYMDYVERATTMRLDTDLFIVKDGSAQDVIDGENDISEMLDSVKTSIKRESEGYVYNFKEIAQSLIYNGAAIVAAIEGVPAELHQPGMEGQVIRFAGYALIRDGKLAAITDPDCAKGINLLTGKVEGGVLTVPDGEGGYASLRLTHSELTLEPEMEGDSLTGLTVRLDLKMNLEGLQNDLDVYDRRVLARLEKAAAEEEKKKAEAALEKARELETDLYGLGKLLELENSGVFPADWETRFPTLSLRARVDTEIIRSYDIGGFVRTGGR